MTELLAPLTLERVSDIAEVASLTGLVRIFEPDIQLCHLPRSSDPLIERYLAVAAPVLGEGFRQVVDVQHGCAANVFPDLPGRQALVNDIAFIVAVYGDLLGYQRVAVRLEVIRRAMCPRFHVDRTGIRLLCTYRGPGTEWLEEGQADRIRMGHGAGGMDGRTLRLDTCQHWRGSSSAVCHRLAEGGTVARQRSSRRHSSFTRRARARRFARPAGAGRGLGLMSK